jgi:pyruvate dehydrogenase complex dehydrogenase (E1) component
VDEFFYVTLMNENYAQPSLPAGVEENIVKGLYRRATVGSGTGTPAVRLLGSGAILREVEAAAQLLADDFGVSSEVFSATSFAGFGRSDTRPALRRFFEVDRQHIVLAALETMALEGTIERKMLAEAISRYGLAPDAPASWSC